MHSTTQFFILLITGAFVIKPTAGLTCYDCRGENNTDCVTRPQNEPTLTSSHEDAYCFTYFITSGSEVEAERRLTFSAKNLTDVVIAGPRNGTWNPEENYLNLTYCKTDLCNAQLYTPPPKLKSTIKCYVCDNKDENCARDVSSKYLMDADPIPFRRNNTSLKTSSNGTHVVEYDPPIGEFMYETYCQTYIYTGGDKPLVTRQPWWFVKGEMSDGQCSSENKREICYCKSHDGCNNKNGSDIIGKSLAVMILMLILRKLSF